MTTKWIKEENFSTKEGFDNGSLPKNPLEQFLQANPLKSIFDSEPVDSRNLKESFLDNEKEWSNIVPIEEPQLPFKKNNDNATSILAKKNRDDKLINSIVITFFSIFIALYVSYNWFFNIIEGFKTKRIKFYEKFDFVNYFYLFTEYFYKIVEFFDKTISQRLPSLIELFKGKERLIFMLVFVISYFSVKSIFDFLIRIYGYLKTYVENGKFNFFKVLYNPKNNNIFASILFIIFVIVGVIESFASMKDSFFGNDINELNKLKEQTDFDPSTKFKDSLMQLKIAHPICYLILLLIRIAIVYGPTVSFSSMLFLLYFKFYSLLGIPYYISQPNEGDIPKSELFKDSTSFIELFRRIHAYMNANNIFREINEPPTSIYEQILNGVEISLRYLFNYSPYIIMFFSLFSVIPSILKIYSPTYKWTGIAIISFLSIVLFKFMINEMPILYVNIQKVKNVLGKVSESMASVFSNIVDNDLPIPVSTSASDSSVPVSSASDSSAP